MSFLSPQHWRGQDDSHVTLDQQLIGSVSRKRKFSLHQFKYLHRIVTRREYRLLQILGIIVIANLLFLSWRAYHQATVEVPRSGGTYSEGLVGSPSTINPLFLHTNDSDRDLTALVYSGLMRYTPDRTIVPDLAEHVDISEDQKTYTFTLRRNVFWHDGEPFDAADVAFTLSRIQDPAVKSPLRASYKDITVKKEDTHRVSFTLTKPFAPFLDLATIPLLPEHLWRELSAEQLPLSALNLKPIGTGPWKFKSLQKDKDGTIRSYTITRNNEYYGEKPHLERLIIKFYPDMQSAVQALKNRHVDGVSFIPGDEYASLLKDSELRARTLYLPQYTALFLNLNGKKELQSRDVRRALAYALDKERIVADGMGGEASAIDGSIPEGLLGYHPDIATYALDREKAEELLDAAGLKKGEDGKRALTIELVTVDTPERARIAEMVKAMWESLGITVALTVEPQGTMRELVLNPRKYDILLYGAVVGSDPDLYPFWHSSQVNAPGLNLSQFAHTDADTLLERARTTPDAQKRDELYRSFQDILAREVPALFLYTPIYHTVLTKEMNGVRDVLRIAYPSDRFGDLSEWYVQSKREWKK